MIKSEVITDVKKKSEIEESGQSILQENGKRFEKNEQVFDERWSLPVSLRFDGSQLSYLLSCKFSYDYQNELVDFPILMIISCYPKIYKSTYGFNVDSISKNLTIYFKETNLINKNLKNFKLVKSRVVGSLLSNGDIEKFEDPIDLTSFINLSL